MLAQARLVRLVAGGILGLLGMGTAAFGQCQVLVRETFRLGDRPHGGNGNLRTAEVHDTLKDYWPQVPSDGTMWITTDQTGVPGWAFAASSLDTAEVDPLDPFNGTAFAEAGGVAVLPFSPPTSAFTISAEAVMGLGSNSTTCLGFTSSAVLSNNFNADGTLWMSLDGQGNWTLRANGAGVVASGQAPIAGTLDTGWLHMEMTYSPAAGLVSARVMDTPIGPLPVTLTRSIAYVGMEARNSWNVLNNLSVFTGTPLGVSIAGAAHDACIGGSVTLNATTNAATPNGVFWKRNGSLVIDGVQAGGSVLSGANTLSLTLTGATAADSGQYECVVSNACGLASSAAAAVSVGSCCPADLDNDGIFPGGTRDGGVDINDLLYFLTGFEAGNVAVDLDNDGDPAAGVPDGGVDISDLLFFLARFEAGC